MRDRFAFDTTWGTTILEGGALFRVWAPAQSRVMLWSDRSARTVAMQRSDDGWFALETDAVAVGEGYGFQLDDGFRVPDPAARAQMDDVHGPSRLVDPRAFHWSQAEWTGRPWHETVLYELHTGTFSEEGSFDGVLKHLDHLERIGVTAVELLPVAQFGGCRGWGYDGTLLYAPHTVYGGPEGLKRLVDAAHERGLMMFLDVVYNHFGPEGSYLHLYAPDFFHPERSTPWGSAIAFEKAPVRRFFIDNALYWLEEFRFDGLRLDAVDKIDDMTEEPILEELARAVRRRFDGCRHVHLCTEDDRNVVSLVARSNGSVPLYSGEWNDDFHHAAHVIATDDAEGYYCDFGGRTHHLARALAEGYVYQGEPSAYRGGGNRGEPSAHLPPTAFVNFIQNHDQTGNRAFGDRLTDLAHRRAVEALTAILLLSPQIPLLFMGEEWGETRPFCFFCDFDGELADAVREGRRNEFRHWSSFHDPHNRELIPDPNALSTFRSSMLEWASLARPTRRARLDLVMRLLAIRKTEIVPRLAHIGGNASEGYEVEDTALCVRWRMGDGSRLSLFANLDDESWPIRGGGFRSNQGDTLLYETASGTDQRLRAGGLPGWSVVVRLAPPTSLGAPGS